MLTGENHEGTLIDHLQELRWAILRSLFSLVLAFPLVFYFSDFLVEFTVSSFCPPEMTLKYFSPMEPLLVKIKLSLYISILLTSPYLLRQMWGFVAPGLLKLERRIGAWLLFSSWALFFFGVFFSLTLIMPLVMKFSIGFQTSYLEAAIGLQQFVSLTAMLAIGFGLMFQLPALVFALVSTGIVSARKLKILRPFVLTCILVVSALLTPPDVVSQLLMALPAYILFEVGLIVSSLIKPVKTVDSADEQPANEETQE